MRTEKLKYQVYEKNELIVLADDNHEEEKVIEMFGTYEELVAFALSEFKGKFEIMCLKYSAIIYVEKNKDNEILSRDFHFQYDDDKRFKILWGYEENSEEEYEHIECHKCGDVGCFSCNPYSFL